MLRFFRHIRQKLFLEGCVSKYLGYALGEILLIVVGILLAVQIGEWKDQHREKSLRQEYIKRLISDFEGELPAFENSINFLTMKRDFAELLLRVARNPKIAEERSVEFLVALDSTSRTNSVPLNTDTIDELQSTGNLRLLDEELKYEIFQYYRRDARLKNSWERYDMIGFEFLKLSRPILSPEQEIWIEKNVDRVWPSDLPEIRAMRFDDASLQDAAIRLQTHQELVAWLPRVKEMHEQILSTNQNLVDRIHKILVMLEERQEN